MTPRLWCPRPSQHLARSQNLQPKFNRELAWEGETQTQSQMWNKNPFGSTKVIKLETLWQLQWVWSHIQIQREKNPKEDTPLSLRFISDKCCGLLLRARKYKLLTFQGEMLFQVVMVFITMAKWSSWSWSWSWSSSGHDHGPNGNISYRQYLTLIIMCLLIRVKTTSQWSRCYDHNMKSKRNSRSSSSSSSSMSSSSSSS